MGLTLVLGGARSGKSRHAQRAAEAEAGRRGRVPVLIATAQAFDDEMADRIARHRAERGNGWRTVEAPIRLAEALAGLAPEDVAVVDCLTLWVSNLLLAGLDPAPAARDLAAVARRHAGGLWLVSNEVGLGIVPDNPLSRRFRDEAGRLHQQLAAAADQVVLMVAGIAMVVKAAGAGPGPTMVDKETFSR
jgi:adenosylcobinamide kinase/adenosylcobinamide-phosphate guanylyltransferase